VKEADEAGGWELVDSTPGRGIRRIRVNGGWLYEYERRSLLGEGTDKRHWHGSNFVRDK
jgi:hypothetical protein